jgi:xylulokinase
VPKDLLLGIDVGTTGTKAVLCNADGVVLAQAAEEYPTSYRHTNWAEQDPDDWWRATCSTVRRALAEAGVAARRIAAVGVSAQAPCLVAVNGAGEPLYPAMLWLDRRA